MCINKQSKQHEWFTHSSVQNADQITLKAKMIRENFGFLFYLAVNVPKLHFTVS